MLEEESIEKAVEGCAFVVHTASPLPIKPPEDENTVIKPAVDGTLAVLRAAHKHMVKRVVITSSTVTINMRLAPNFKDIYTEEDWSDIEGCYTAYDKSKVLAEKAAWDFHSSLTKEEQFEMTTLIPGLILGPGLVQGEFSSMNYIRMFLLGFMPAYPNVRTPLVDIRDLSLAHLQAVRAENAGNKRIIMSNKAFHF